jgi:hypothetical protein
MYEMNQLLVVYAAVAHMFCCMIAVAIESRKRKRHAHAPIGEISYGPIEEWDRSRIDYLNNKIWKNDVIGVNILRLSRASFFRLYDLICERDLFWKILFPCALSSKLLCFLHTIGHNVRNRLVITNFTRSGETVSRYLNKVLHVIGDLHNNFISPPSSITPAKIIGNPRWDPYFKVVALLYKIQCF